MRPDCQCEKCKSPWYPMNNLWYLWLLLRALFQHRHKYVFSGNCFSCDTTVCHYDKCSKCGYMKHVVTDERISPHQRSKLAAGMNHA